MNKPIVALLSFCALTSIASAQSRNTNVRHVKPEGLTDSPRYSQAIEVKGGRIVFFAGQMPVDKEGKLVGRGDFRAQATQAYDNLMLALKAVGMDASNVVKLTMYVTNIPETNAVHREVRARYFKPGVPPPTATLVGVTSLALDGQMIEVSAVAAGK
ncbi:MAG: RidA family protein [Bryobacteraceae bacterium]